MTARIAALGAVLSFCLLPTAAFAQYPNIQVSGPPFPADPEEVSISINPANPLNLAAGSNLDYYYYSMDGGLTWQQGRLTSPFGVWGDPSVAFDADGNLYYAHLSYPGQTPGDWLDRIVVQKSTDGGVSWSSGVGVGLNPPKDQDKEWISADLTDSPYRNNLYMAWTEFDNLLEPTAEDSSFIVFSRSTDHGATWSPPVTVSEVGGLAFDDSRTVEGAVPAVGPNGEVYLSWAGHNLIYFDKSLDGGVTWGTDVIVTSQPGGWNFDIPGIYRCDGFPTTMCDISNSPYRGHVYIVFSDQRNGVDDTDVFFVESTDGGSIWSSPVPVVDELWPAHQFFPWSTIDPVTGNIYVVFYDRRFTSGDATDVYVAMSEDGGDNWIDFKVSETPFTPDERVFFGDYIGIAAFDDKVYPIWARMDGNGPLSIELSLWLAIVDASQVPTLVRSYRAEAVSRGVEVVWTLVEVGVGMEFFVSRAEAGDGIFGEIPVVLVESDDGFSFRFVDVTCERGLRYIYRVEVRDENERRLLFETNAVEVPAVRVSLGQNVPNPFHRSTTIEFVLARRAGVNVSVYTATGALVRSLIDQPLEAGPHTVEWNGQNSRGESVPSGVYFYKLRTGKQSVTKKMTLIK
jgi:hypothetical protein